MILNEGLQWNNVNEETVLYLNTRAANKSSRSLKFYNHITEKDPTRAALNTEEGHFPWL